MFTGIIEAVGKAVRAETEAEGAKFGITSPFGVYVLGESIAVNGICLTVTAWQEDMFWAQASSETLKRTNLGAIRPGSEVHLERALRLGDRLGGHWVSGHVDGTGRIMRSVPHGASLAVTIEPPAPLMRYIVEKGSIALDGASLTVNRVGAHDFDIMLIPHSQAVLMRGFAEAGRIVNIEVDILGKYVEKLLSCKDDTSNDISGSQSLTLEKLRENGFF